MLLVTDGVFAAGITTLRVPIGATDFSNARQFIPLLRVITVTEAPKLLRTVLSIFEAWSYDNTSSADTTLASFNIGNAASRYCTVLTDIVGVNSQLKIMLCPWSPVCLRDPFSAISTAY